MPFFLGDPAFKDGRYEFNWNPSFDLQGDNLTYDFFIGRDPDFKNISASYKNLKTFTCTVNNLTPGEYYWQVIVRDSKGNWQQPFDFIDANGTIKLGIRKFVITEDHQVSS